MKESDIDDVEKYKDLIISDEEINKIEKFLKSVPLNTRQDQQNWFEFVKS
jgi:hypothetical protein